MTRILIADDHELIRQGLRRILQSSDDLIVVGEAASGPEVVAALKEAVPDVAAARPLNRKFPILPANSPNLTII